jgi:hypothetical protein
MRLSGLVYPAVLFVSATLFAQHTSGGGGSASFGGSSGSGASHGSYSGGSVSSASSASSRSSSSGASHVASSGVSSPSSKLPPGKGAAEPQKNTSRSFFHPFRKPKPVPSADFRRRVPCLKEPCGICPRNGKGSCTVASNVCGAGQSWNGFACGSPFRFSDCGSLADQLAAQERQMRGQSDPGQMLFYRLLRRQYESCLARPGFRAYGGASIFDTLLDTP